MNLPIVRDDGFRKSRHIRPRSAFGFSIWLEGHTAIDPHRQLRGILTSSVWVKVFFWHSFAVAGELCSSFCHFDVSFVRPTSLVDRPFDYSCHKELIVLCFIASLDLVLWHLLIDIVWIGILALKRLENFRHKFDIGLFFSSTEELREIRFHLIVENSTSLLVPIS